MRSKQGETNSAIEDGGHRRFLLLILLACLFICVTFSAVATGLVAFVQAGTAIAQPTSFYARLAIKGCFFVVAAVGCAFALWRTRFPLATKHVPHTSSESARNSWIGLSVVALFMVGILSPNLSRYPDAMPDEVHHLVVSRNIAEHNLYASGHPESGFKVLDDYDSVGPPVLLPVAAAFRLFGTGFVSGRAVMALYCLLLVLTIHFFLRGPFGGNAAVVGSFAAGTGWGTVYLGRTLYGEVPALLFLLVGLILWRRALKDERPLIAGLAAGIAIGLAILCKYYMVMSAWAFFGAWVYDRVTFRAIRWRHVVSLGVGTVTVLVVWAAVQHGYRDVVDNAAGQMATYRGLFLFGLDSPPKTLAWLARFPLTVVVAIVGMVSVLPIVTRRRYDPATVAAYLFAAFVVYWWIFFTDGHVPRYLWYGLTLYAAFAGAGAYRLLRNATRPGLSTVRRLALSALAVGVVVVAAKHASGEVHRVMTADEMRDARQLAVFARDFEPGAPIATTYWPVVKLLNFTASRNVPLLKPEPSLFEGYRAIIVHGRSQKDLVDGSMPTIEIGRYAVLINSE